MKITKDNYEIYFLDYMDGNLSPKEIQELKAFLLIHPDLEEWLHTTEAIRFTAPSISFPDKESLKKDISHECPDYYAIAAAENQLTSQDRKVLGRRIHTSVFQSLTNTYIKLKINPDLHIHFEKKRQLYRKNESRIWFYRIGGVAAGIVFLVGIGFLLLQSPEKQEIRTRAQFSTVPNLPTTVVSKTNTSPSSNKTETINSPTTNESRRGKAKPVPQEEKQLPRENLSPFPIILTETAQIENDLPQKDLWTLKSKSQSISEIYLTDNANTWKRSGSTGFFSDNIVSLAIVKGKNLTEKMKEKFEEYRIVSNKSVNTTVIP